jgi:hypothetical protein
VQKEQANLEAAGRIPMRPYNLAAWPRMKVPVRIPTESLELDQIQISSGALHISKQRKKIPVNP